MPEQITHERIDAHHHLWRYTPEEFGWIDDRMSLLRRDFTADDLGKELTGAGWSGSVRSADIFHRWGVPSRW